MRSEDVEGEWISVIRDKGTITGTGFAYISFEQNTYVEFGEQRDTDGRLVYSWKTNISRYADKRLTYSYYTIVYKDNRRLDGNGHYDFHTLSAIGKDRWHRKKLLCEYDGYYANNGDASVYGVNGHRVRYFLELYGLSEVNDELERKRDITQKYLEFQRTRLLRAAVNHVFDPVAPGRKRK